MKKVTLLFLIFTLFLSFSVNAQDEMQVLEHPVLASIRHWCITIDPGDPASSTTDLPEPKRLSLSGRKSFRFMFRSYRDRDRQNNSAAGGQSPAPTRNRVK